MIVNKLDIIGNEHLWRTHCNLQTEFRDGRYSLNQNFILCLQSKYLLPGFCSKAIYIHIILNYLIWKGILWWFYLMIENIWGEIVLCHSDWIKIIGHVVHYPCAIYALIYILQKFPAGYCLCNNLLSNSCAILPKAGRFKLRISLIS